jgi:hypothetical protein
VTVTDGWGRSDVSEVSVDAVKRVDNKRTIAFGDVEDPVISRRH